MGLFYALDIVQVEIYNFDITFLSTEYEVQKCAISNPKPQEELYNVPRLCKWKQ